MCAQLVEFLPIRHEALFSYDSIVLIFCHYLSQGLDLGGGSEIQGGFPFSPPKFRLGPQSLGGVTLHRLQLPCHKQVMRFVDESK